MLGFRIVVPFKLHDVCIVQSYFNVFAHYAFSYQLLHQQNTNITSN